jgi:hypothetical protein
MLVCKRIISVLKRNLKMRIEVLMAWSIKMAVFWFVALCSLVEVY